MIPRIVPAPLVGNVHVNKVAIRGTEAVIVDTGMPAERDEWLALTRVNDPWPTPRHIRPRAMAAGPDVRLSTRIG